MATRYDFIDAIRGIAACSVMLQHSLYASGLLGNWPHEKLTGFIPTWLELGETGVVAFFLVSGFVIPLSLEKTADFRLFWRHRAFRIYPLYLAVFAISFVIAAGGSVHSLKAFAANFGAHLFFVQEYLKQENFVGGSWTLSLEMIWYITISGAFLLSLNKHTNLLVTGGIVLSIAAQILCAAGHHLPMGRLSMLMCCILGLVCYRYAFSQISLKHFASLAALLVLTIVANLLVGLGLFPSPHPTASFGMAIDSWALAALIFFVPFATRGAALWQHSVLSFLGRISYSVYLLHPVVLTLLLRIPLTGVVLIAATFALTIILSILSYRTIEAPAIRFGHVKRIPAALPAAES